MKQGLIQAYTGDGKGKTTAAMGLALRALGRDFKVEIIQFLKGSSTGEVIFFKESNFSNLNIQRFNSQKKFIWNMNDEEKEILKKDTAEGIEVMENIIKNNTADLLILDEAFWVVNNNLSSADKFISLLKNKPQEMEIVMTGRDAHEDILAICDLVTEMKCIKHPFEQGINARVGIEF